MLLSRVVEKNVVTEAVGHHEPGGRRYNTTLEILLWATYEARINSMAGLDSRFACIWTYTSFDILRRGRKVLILPSANRGRSVPFAVVPFCIV